MRPKLILTDLDGTLLREDKSLSPSTAPLWAGRRPGAEVVLATGRFYGRIPRSCGTCPFCGISF